MGLRKLNIPLPSFSYRSTSQDDQLVCVTGSWGFLGSWIVKLLLQQGYNVKSTISLTPEERSSLQSCHGAQDHLYLAQVDLLDYCSLSELFQGCTAVFHVPAPNYDINGLRDYPVEIIDNEVRSVLNVVEACANTSSIRKMVLTSCLSSVLWDKQYYSTGVVLDERNWSDLEFCRKEKMWSALCKTLTEKAAWALARDKGLDLVVMNPATVVEAKKANLHSHHPSIKNTGTSKALDQSGIFAYVHVDDLAAAHILALQMDRAMGRYICFERLLTKADIMEAAREIYPNCSISSRLESFNPCVLSNEKLKDLGMNFSSEAKLVV